MERKSRGWLNIIGAIVAGYLAYAGNNQWSLYVLALLFLLSGWHHASTKK
ncbi:MAG TPA: hypothetical protein VLJ21_00095 [Candidatus Binatia bacterium]|nr:hypothetical protein [Candidatus Binatia bacterium]